MKIIIVMINLILAANLFAEGIDYSYCSKFIDYINAQENRTGFSFPFKLNAKTGKLETVDQSLDYNGEAKGKHVYTGTEKAGVKDEYTVMEKDSNKMDKIIFKKLKSLGSLGYFALFTSKIQFEIRNNKCIPKIAHGEGQVDGKKVKSTIFDTKLCKEIAEFFASKKDIVNKCLDSNSKENKAMESLLSRSGYDTSEIATKMAPYFPALNRLNYSVEQKILAGTTTILELLDPEKKTKMTGEKHNKMLGIMGGSPLMSAYMILNDCYYERGFEELLADDSVWAELSKDSPVDSIGADTKDNK